MQQGMPAMRKAPAISPRRAPMPSSTQMSWRFSATIVENTAKTVKTVIITKLMILRWSFRLLTMLPRRSIQVLARTGVLIDAVRKRIEIRIRCRAQPPAVLRSC